MEADCSSVGLDQAKASIHPPGAAVAPPLTLDEQVLRQFTCIAKVAYNPSTGPFHHPCSEPGGLLTCRVLQVQLWKTVSIPHSLCFCKLPACIVWQGLHVDLMCTLMPAGSISKVQCSSALWFGAMNLPSQSSPDSDTSALLGFAKHQFSHSLLRTKQTCLVFRPDFCERLPRTTAKPINGV